MSLQLQAHLTGRSPAGVELRRDAPRLLGGAVLVYGLLAAAGLLVNRVLSHGAFGRWDLGVSRWFSEHRTPALNSLTRYGSLMSDTKTAIAVTAVLVVGLRIWLGRWRESAVILLCIVGELTIFLAVTSTVHRTRPTVPHLDRAPPTSSFPSGHTGAAVALYVGLAVILLAVTRDSARRKAFVIAAALLCGVPVIVATSRVYRGMHYATDVTAGALAGGLWMVIVVRTLLTHHNAREADG
jgi:undecaprenyl-diphosphatase